MKTAPDPKDVLDFQFKQLSSLKISEGFDSVPAACSLIVVDGKRGLIYAACDNKITVLKSGDNPDKDWKREYVLSAKVTRLALNCDCSLLVITLHHPIAYVYNAASFTQQNLELLHEIKLSSAENAHVLDLRWNPCIPGTLCTITSDYTVRSFNMTADKILPVLPILEKLEKLEVLCVAWSPKGKQLVVGCKNGNLLQLRPDQVARQIVGPNPSIGSVISLLWISNYQFCAAYLDPQDLRINVLIIDAPKGEANATFTSYEDITYGSPGIEGEEGGPRYYFEHISEWGIIVAASSSSSEVAILGSRDHGTTWEQWQLVDSGRAQLPLVRTSESYPVGLAVDRTSVNKLPWGGDGLTLPHPVPVLHILGTSGQLCSFHMVNLIPGVPGVCSPPTETVPASNQPRMSLVPTEISFNLAGGVTSTPRPKQIDTSQDRSKTAAPANLFGEMPRISVPQPPQVELNVPKPQAENVEPLSKTETITAPSKEVNQQEKIGIDSNVCIRTYQEECSLFEKELKSRREGQTVDIGTAIERSQLIEKSEKMERFLIDLQETTASLTSDISCLKNLLLQTFAWLEETKSRCASDTSNNPQIYSDSDKSKELRSQMYYVQSKLEQAMRALDHEWLEHINKEKNKMKVPRLELVYQNMLRQSQIIAEEKNNIQGLVKKWKALTRGDITSSLNKSMANMSLLSLMSPGISDTSRAIEQRCKTIASRSCNFSREKQSKLRNLLSRSTTKIIQAATPSPIHDHLKQTLSSLANQTPPKQPQEQKTKSKSDAKSEQVVVAANPPPQTARSPLASLDRIVANIGSVGAQPNINAQSRVPAPSAASNPPIIKIPQVDSKARAAAVLPVPQTTTTTGQSPRQNKPASVSLFGTPQTPKPLSAIPSGLKPMPMSEVSPFTSNTSRTSAPPLLPPALLPTATPPSATKLFSKIDTAPFNSGSVKSDVSPTPPMSTGISPSMSSPTIVAALAPAPPVQTSPQTSFSFSSPTQPLASQLPSYPSTPKTSPPPVATTPSAKSSPLQTFSFASKPANSTPFSFASKPTTNPPSSAAQSLDLSAMGLDLQAPSNTSVENSIPATTTTGSSFFGSSATLSGSIFGGNTSATKDKSPGTILGNSGFSSIFSGSTAGGNAPPVFGGGTTTPTVKSPIFGGGATSPSASVFGGSSANPPKPAGGEIPAASPPASGFENPVNSAPNSIFGKISSTANSASVFGGNSSGILNTSALGGATTLPAQVFGEATTSPIKPPIFAGDSAATSPTASTFGRPPDPKPSIFGGVSTSSTPSPFGGTATGPSNTSIFGGGIANPPAAPAFGGAATIQSTASVFGSVPPVSPNQSIFGGAAVNPVATNTAAPAASASGFGQAATFGAKPEFGSIFGASKPVFGGGGFATSTFPNASQPTSGFGGFNAPSMGVNISAVGGGSMQKVFGESSGSSTFENLAAQEGGLTFGNLAQKQAEPAPPPAFSGKSSFQSWR